MHNLFAEKKKSDDGSWHDRCWTFMLALGGRESLASSTSHEDKTRTAVIPSEADLPGYDERKHL